jgi:hypothetical protein
MNTKEIIGIIGIYLAFIVLMGLIVFSNSPAGESINSDPVRLFSNQAELAKHFDYTIPELPCEPFPGENPEDMVCE